MRKTPTQIVCYQHPYLKYRLAVSSGIHYAPFGGGVTLDGRRIRVPLTVAASYQTDFGHNYALTARLELPTLFDRAALPIDAHLNYQQLQATSADVHFTSYTATMGLHFDDLAARAPTLLLEAGYALCRPLTTDAVGSSGYGYGFGLRHTFFTSPYQLNATAHATHWPGYWQWQGSLTHYFKSFQAGVSINQLRRYTEISLMVSWAFY